MRAAEAGEESADPRGVAGVGGAVGAQEVGLFDEADLDLHGEEQAEERRCGDGRGDQEGKVPAWR